ncbi:DNA polymerase III, delta subunit [Elusimicrobium minutum Pei191]|uniref:DNA polymerase III subunit delta n=1 Tax=Elusimicrobium minutum (strain Pei191) TaxID=445932 RepID=B2KB07_ELUMP|nr:DNA polymerase III subunit delta [Elusimicrobium minutum]ACC97766.1 DNA polymerase III, delta subunit [Elusimicrobium minutum Pei191]
MTVTDVNTLAKNLADGNISPVYFFTGEDVYRKSAMLERIVKKINADDFNVTKEDASKTDFGEILALANTAPVFSDRRIIFLNNIDKLKKDAQSALLNYLELPMHSTVLVLFHNDAKKLKTDASVKKAAEAVGTVIDFAELKGPALNAWIKNKFKEKGLSVEPEACELLIDMTGSDLAALESEIEKISLYKNMQGTATSADILECVGYSREENPFALSNAVLACDRKTALTLVGKLLGEGESPVSILNKISASVLKMTRIKRLVNAGYSNQEIVSSAGLMFWEGRLVSSARMFPSEQTMLKTLNKIIDADIALKTSSGHDPKVLLKGILLTMFSK